MTIETFEKATELRKQIDAINDLQNVIANAKNNYLAAVKTTGSAIVTSNIINSAKIPEGIADQFESILFDRISKLEREFAEL